MATEFLKIGMMATCTTHLGMVHVLSIYIYVRTRQQVQMHVHA